MTEGKPPVLCLTEDKALSVRVWRKKFNAWCTLQKGWRDSSKEPSDHAHWKDDKHNVEISAFYLALPDDVLTMFDISIYPKMTDAERKQPWTYQEKLAEHFQGKDNVMPERLNFFNCVQKPSETISDYEMRIRSIASKTKFELMTDPLQELMRDRLCTGVNNNDLRQLLLHHYQEDGKTVHSFDDQLNKAKAWEAAHRTNSLIEQATHTVEQVNFSQSKRGTRGRGPTQPSATHQSSSPSVKPPCGWCGGPRHPRSACPANDPTTLCQTCGMKGNHFTSVCRQKSRAATSQTASRRKQKQQSANAVAEVQSSGDEDDYVVHAFTTYSIT
jgi:hypothetical protein